ncbi:MAG: pitrilysin family protein [Thermoanaerobaculia bacterium]
MKLQFFLPLLLTAGILQAAEPAGVTLPPYQELHLKNGATVLLMEKHDVPMIAFTARLRGGAIDDPSGKEGVTAITAEMLQKGAGKRSAAEFASAVDGAGADLSVSPGLEETLVRGEFLARDSDLMVELLSDLLIRPAFPEDELAKVRQQAIERLAAAKDGDPRWLIGTYFHAWFFGDHPYGNPLRGTATTLATITRKDVLDDYRANFGGNRLILAVVGDFDAKGMAGRIEKAFGEWARTPAPAPVAPPTAASKGRRVLLVDKPDATQTYFWIGNLGIARTDPDYVATDLANTVFGGRFTSMINSELRIKSGLTYGASSVLDLDTRPGALAISSYTKNDSTEKAVDLSLDVLKRFHQNGLDAETLASAKAYVLGQYPPELERNGQLASKISELAFYGLDRSDVDEYAARVNAVTTEGIRKVIDRVYPTTDNLTFVFIGKASAIRDVVKKYGPVEEMKITDPGFRPAKDVNAAPAK